jgi:hypothetical protein
MTQAMMSRMMPTTGSAMPSDSARVVPVSSELEELDWQ